MEGLDYRDKWLLTDLLQDNAIQPKSSFCILKNLRNQGMHISLINIHVRVGSSRNIVSLRTDPQTNLEIIPYLEPL
jgi:hypothetical protein